MTSNPAFCHIAQGKDSCATLLCCCCLICDWQQKANREFLQLLRVVQEWQGSDDWQDKCVKEHVFPKQKFASVYASVSTTAVPTIPYCHYIPYCHVVCHYSTLRCDLQTLDTKDSLKAEHLLDSAHNFSFKPVYCFICTLAGHRSWGYRSAKALS